METEMTEPYDHSVLFPNDFLVDYANHLLRAAASPLNVTRVRSRSHAHVRFDAIGPRGGHVDIVAPMGMPRIGMLFFRSLLKVRPGASNAKWLINGQQSTGTSEIVFLGENGPWLTTTIDNVRAYYRTALEHIKEDGKERFADSLEERVRDVAERGSLSEEAEVHTWDGGHQHTPLQEGRVAPAL